MRARIDKLAQGTCPGCGEFRGSLWVDRSNPGVVIAPCIKCRKKKDYDCPLPAADAKHTQDKHANKGEGT